MSFPNPIYGVCNQTAPSPTLTAITNFQLTSLYYGNNWEEKGDIDPAQQVTTDINAAGSWQVPAGGLANLFSTDEAVPVIYKGSITYDTSNISDEDLPADGECAIRIGISMAPYGGKVNPQQRSLSPYVFAEGLPSAYWPTSDFGGYIEIPDLTRAQVNAGTTTTTPEFLTSPVPFVAVPTLTANRMRFLGFRTGGAGNIEDISIQVQIKQANGLYTTQSTQRIGFASDSINEFLINLPTYEVTQLATSTVTAGTLGNVNYITIPPDQRINAVMNAGNGFSAGEEAFIDTLYIQGEDPPIIRRCNHSFQLNWNSAPLLAEASLYPETELQVRYVISTDSGRTPDEVGFIDYEDIGDYTFITGFEMTRATAITGGVVDGPTVIVDNAAFFRITTEMNERTFFVQVELQRTDGTWVPSQPQTILVPTPDTVMANYELNPF